MSAGKAEPKDTPRATVLTRGLSAANLHPIARTPAEWEETLERWGERRYHARQIFRWIHKRGTVDPEQMTDLGKPLRERLKQEGLASVAELASTRRAADGTRKLLLRLHDQQLIECVLIPMTDALAGEADLASIDDEENGAFDAGAPMVGPSEDLADRINRSSDRRKRRVTLCVSTQHGCAMGCVFCASGRNGLTRGLSAAEIVAQVHEARRHLDPEESLTNLVFMGMGEPLHHYDETARAIRLLATDDGVGLGLRRMTVSTVGLTRGIDRLGQDFEGKIGLAVSLHAPNDALRSQIVPMNERIDLAKIVDALKRYPLPRRRRITIEYILIDGINDGRVHAKELTRLLRPLRVKVNLIAMNPVLGTDLVGSARERVAQFQEWVAEEGYSCFVRTRRGDDVSAACGQLALRKDRGE